MAARSGKTPSKKKSTAKAGRKTTASRTKKAVAKKTSAKKAAQKKGSRKATAKKGPNKKASKKAARPKPSPKTQKQVARKKAAAKKSSPKKPRSTAPAEEVEIDMELIDEVDDLLDEKPPTPKKAEKKRGPKTPTVPRAVKPAPREVENDMGPDVLEFIAAIDKYKAEHCRPFPNWTEVFHILRQLGYRKTD